MTAYNPSTCKEEEATRKTCPRCRGFGAITGDEDGCTLCHEVEEVWNTTGGWTWPVGKRSESGKLY